MMGSQIFILATAMVIAGFFGGLINYYLDKQNNAEIDKETHPRTLQRWIVLGVGAAFLVPVVLSMVSSDLIAQAQNGSDNLLKYTGYCLIAAILPRFLFTSISKQILDESISSKEMVESIKHQLKVLEEELVPLLDTETEQDVSTEDAINLAKIEEELDITCSKTLKVLGSGRFIFRSLIGLCQELNTDEATMEKTLKVLVNRGLAGKVNGRKGQRWYITEKGRRVMDASLYTNLTAVGAAITELETA